VTQHSGRRPCAAAWRPSNLMCALGGSPTLPESGADRHRHRELVTRAVHQLGMPTRSLDLAVWEHESGQQELDSRPASVPCSSGITAGRGSTRRAEAPDAGSHSHHLSPPVGPRTDLRGNGYSGGVGCKQAELVDNLARRLPTAGRSDESIQSVVGSAIQSCCALPRQDHADRLAPPSTRHSRTR
jgi:hypothetical protein